MADKDGQIKKYKKSVIQIRPVHELINLSDVFCNSVCNNGDELACGGEHTFKDNGIKEIFFSIFCIHGGPGLTPLMCTKTYFIKLTYNSLANLAGDFLS